MKSVIVHMDGRRINLASTIDPELYAELEDTQGRGSRKDPLLSCGGCGDGVYIRHGSVRRDELFGAHYDRSDCPETLVIRKSVMSDEHKRMQEYTVRAASDGGFGADTEVRTTRGTRVDVVVDRRIGFEVQLSGLTAGAAVRRTARSMNAGLETVAWVAENTAASWTGKVPGYQWLDNGQVLRGMPSPRSVRSRGVLTFRAERSWRGGWEPRPEPLTVLVDDAVVRMAEGSIRPVILGGNVHLVRANGVALYEELACTRLAPFTAGRTTFRRALAPSPEQPCARPPAEAVPFTDLPCARPPTEAMSFSDFLAQSVICSKCGQYRSMDPSGLCYLCRPNRLSEVL